MDNCTRYSKVKYCGPSIKAVNELKMIAKADHGVNYTIEQSLNAILREALRQEGFLEQAFLNRHL